MPINEEILFTRLSKEKYCIEVHFCFTVLLLLSNVSCRISASGQHTTLKGNNLRQV